MTTADKLEAIQNKGYEIRSLGRDLEKLRSLAGSRLMVRSINSDARRDIDVPMDFAPILLRVLEADILLKIAELNHQIEAALK
jgi:hypothetical protein